MAAKHRAGKSACRSDAYRYPKLTTVNPVVLATTGRIEPKNSRWHGLGRAWKFALNQSGIQV